MATYGTDNGRALAGDRDLSDKETKNKPVAKIKKPSKKKAK